MPDMRCMKFSATRSAPSRPRAWPVTNRIGSPFLTRQPSSCSTRIVPLGSICRKASSASGTPQIVPVPRATSVARARRSETTVAIVVTSLNAWSSSSAARTVFWSSVALSGKRRSASPSYAGTDSGVIVRGTLRRSARRCIPGVSMGSPSDFASASRCRLRPLSRLVASSSLTQPPVHSPGSIVSGTGDSAGPLRPPIAIMRSIAPRARAATSGATVMGYCMCSSERSTLGSVVTFM